MTEPLDVFALPVHPAADVFPMLDSEELDELAADISANGLQFPIVIGRYDGEHVLVDGRNRREACRRAGIDPTVTYLNGEDPLKFIMSSNVRRRHLSKGQLAMVVALMHPEPKRGMHSELNNSTEGLGFDKAYLAKARLVLRATPEAVDRVMAGTFALDAAVKAADAESKKQQLERDADARLERKALDLFNRYKRGELTRQEAEATREKRESQDRERREFLFGTVIKLLRAVQLAGGTAIRELPAIIADVDHYAEFKQAGGDIAYDPDIRQEVERVFSDLIRVLDGLPLSKRSVGRKKGSNDPVSPPA